MPQTRFVLKKSLELGLKPIVVINKIDKAASNPARVHDEVLELFIELGANDEQADFPIVYSIGREGIAKKKLTDGSKDLSPLLDTVLEQVRPASSPELLAKPLRLQPFNLAYDNYLGRMAVARIYEGTITPGMSVFIKKPSGESRPGKIVKLFGFVGLHRVETESAGAGDIALVAGLTDIDIGETVSASADAEPLPAIAVDEPTITLNFLVNNSPFGGKEGKFVTSRQLRDRLEKELEINVGLRVDFSSGDTYKVSGRGELHIAILLENMRREGYEMQVGQPQVLVKEIDGKKCEPVEVLSFDVPQEYSGKVIELVSQRKGDMLIMEPKGDLVHLEFEIP